MHLQKTKCASYNSFCLFYFLDLVHNRTKFKLLDIRLENKMNMAQEYRSLLCTSMHKKSNKIIRLCFSLLHHWNLAATQIEKIKIDHTMISACISEL